METDSYSRGRKGAQTGRLEADDEPALAAAFCPPQGASGFCSPGSLRDSPSGSSRAAFQLASNLLPPELANRR
jgi:hypothetical protein